MHSLWELVSFQICFFYFHDFAWGNLWLALLPHRAAVSKPSLWRGGHSLPGVRNRGPSPSSLWSNLSFFSLSLSSPNRKSLHRLQRIVQKQTQAFFPHKAHTELGLSHKRSTGNFPWLACAPRQAPLHLSDARGISLKVAGGGVCSSVRARRASPLTGPYTRDAGRKQRRAIGPSRRADRPSLHRRQGRSFNARVLINREAKRELGAEPQDRRVISARASWSTRPRPLHENEATLKWMTNGILNMLWIKYKMPGNPTPARHE